MKSVRLLIGLMTVMFLASCDPDDYQHPDVLRGSWVSIANGKATALNLVFDYESLTVNHGSWDYRPFTYDDEWEYYMTKDSVLHIYRTKYDGDGDYSTESYELDLSFSDSFNTLTLWYKPAFSSLRKYTLIRR